MLSLENVGIEFAGRWLLRNASYQFGGGQRIGLVGRNGTGKSTLLKMIVGDLSPTEGRVHRMGDMRIAFFNQDLLSYESHLPVFDIVRQAFADVLVLQAKADDLLAQIESGDAGPDEWDEYAHLMERLDHMDASRMDAQVYEVLAGLGIEQERHHAQYSTFSGGWRMRVQLAKMLLSEPDLLLLDEPTNHLDLPSIQWLESYVTSVRSTVVIVSHDREFLDRMVTTVVEIRNSKLHTYAGNYAFYLQEREVRTEQHKREYEKQQDEIRQHERFIERFKAKASKAAQAQSRVKALDRLDRIEAPEAAAAEMKIRFDVAQQPGREVLMLNNATKIYPGNKVILVNTNATVERGDKIALIGANGLGKSTVLRMLAGTEPFEGERKEGYNVNMGFFAQHQLESLTPNNNMIEELASARTTHTETELRTLLGCFMFTGDEVEKKIKILSGGERSRVALAKTLLLRSNLLMLDEPTNHLDISSVELLAQSMQLYEGTFIVISHDRHFLAKVANKIWYIEDHEIKEYPGTYAEWEAWMKRRAEAARANAEPTKPKKVAEPVVVTEQPKAPEQTAEQQKQNKNRLKKLQHELEAIEADITKLEDEKFHLEQELAKPEVSADFARLNKGMEQVKVLQQKIAQLMVKWEAQAAEIEKG